MWTALYDILLEWIDHRNQHIKDSEQNLNYSQSDAEGVHMNAYADDLGTIVEGKRAAYMQQIQANWISAFCTFTGLVMNPNKIAPTHVGTPPANQCQTLRVHQQDGHPIDIVVDYELPSFKYLGVQLDLRNNPLISFNQLYLKAQIKL